MRSPKEKWGTHRSQGRRAPRWDDKIGRQQKVRPPAGAKKRAGLQREAGSMGDMGVLGCRKPAGGNRLAGGSVPGEMQGRGQGGNVNAGNDCGASRAGSSGERLGPEGCADIMPADCCYSLGRAGGQFNSLAAFAISKRRRRRGCWVGLGMPVVGSSDGVWANCWMLPSDDGAEHRSGASSPVTTQSIYFARSFLDISWIGIARIALMTRCWPV